MLSLLATATHAQSPFSDPTNSYSTTLPQHWVPGPQLLLDRGNAELAKRTPDQTNRFIAAFVLDNAPPNADPPYILVQFNKLQLRGLTYAEISKGLGIDFQEAANQTVNEKFSDVVKSVAFDKPIFDKSLNRYIMTSKMQVDGAGPSRTLSAGFLTSSGILQLNCYAPESSYNQYAPDFAAIIGAVRIDPAHTFVPADPAIRISKTFNSATGRIIACAILGIIIAAILKAVSIWQSRTS